MRLQLGSLPIYIAVTNNEFWPMVSAAEQHLCIMEKQKQKFFKMYYKQKGNN